MAIVPGVLSDDVGFDRVDHLVTDTRPTGALADALRQDDVDVVVPED